jgi:thioredoxin reductase
MTEVLVVGAGPVGLTMAPEAARYGQMFASSIPRRDRPKPPKHWCCGAAPWN